MYVIKRLYREYLGKYSIEIFIAIFFMICVAVCSAILVKVVQPAIDQIFLKNNKEMLVLIPISVFILSIIKGIAEYFQSYIIKNVGQKVLTDIQADLYKHLLHSDLSSILTHSSSRIISRFTNDISLMRGAVSNLLVGIAKHLLTVVFLIFLMFTLDYVLSCIIFIVLPLVIIPVQILGRKVRIISSKTQEEFGNYTAKLDETFKSVRIIKIFNAEKCEVERTLNINRRILNLYRSSISYESFISPLMEGISGFAIGVMIWYGGYKISQNATTPGALFAFITAFVSAYRPLKSLVSLAMNLQEGIAAARRVFGILDQKPKIHDRDLSTEIFDVGDIEFQNVDFEIDGKNILKNVSMTIPGKSIVGIVGISGSGKTTLINLLCRLYEPTNGNITISNLDIRDIKISSLREKISIVSQDVLLFDESIRYNISYPKFETEIQDVIAAAEKANADFISDYENHFIGEFGNKLSGGQKQRIAIARALVKKAPIMIFDEATSALDPISDTWINKSIREENYATRIIVSHRISSLQNADMIFVFKSGILVQQGKHEELIEDIFGEYYQLRNSESSP